MDLPERDALGTLLRTLLDRAEADIAATYPALGLHNYRPRYSPFIRALAAGGAMPIRDLARTVGVTHSAASQTIAQMTRDGLVRLEPGSDARQRVAHLTDHARGLIPAITAEWAATTAAVADLDAELPMPLADLITQALRALDRRPLRDRIHHNLPISGGGSTAG
jgi:DNA-binding MarR family transcriptional regulator